MDSFTGHLLVAAPSLHDPNFARAVVAIAHHDADGAIGIVLNRPSNTAVHEAAPELGDLVGGGDVVHVGGPVQPAAIVMLAKFADPDLATFRVTESIGLVGDRTPLSDLGELTSKRRIYAGYAGWGPGQLDSEIDREDWITTPADAADVFCEHPLALWSDVLDRMGGPYRLVARMPLDPSMN